LVQPPTRVVSGSPKNADVLFPQTDLQTSQTDPSTESQAEPNHPRNLHGDFVEPFKAAEQAAEAERLRLEEVGRSGVLRKRRGG